MKNIFTSYFFRLVLIICVSLLVSSLKSSAQIRKDYSNLLTKQTLTNTDTSYIIYQAESSTKNIMVRLTKTSGTPAGKVYLYGTIDETNYDLLDSLTVTNVATQYKYFTYAGTLDALQYYKYKIIFYQTGTAVTIPKFYVLKR
jgi:hypothetical protein